MTMNFLDKIDNFFEAGKPRLKWNQRLLRFFIAPFGMYIMALVVYGVIDPVIDNASFISYWLWVFILATAYALIGDLMMNRHRIASCVILLCVIAFAILYIFNVDVRSVVYDIFLPIGANA